MDGWQLWDFGAQCLRAGVILAGGRGRTKGFRDFLLGIERLRRRGGRRACKANR